MAIVFGRENMKCFSKSLFGLFFGLSLVLSALPAHAQDPHRVDVTMPFDFVVGAKQLKAVNYVVESLLDNSALRFRSEGWDIRQIVFTVPIEINQTGNHERLLFHHDGGRYFLSQTGFRGNKDGRELTP